MNIFNPKINEIKLEKIIGLDTEFNTLDTKNAKISALSINCPKSKINYALDLNSNIYSKKEIIELLEKIKKCDIILAHNAKVDIAVLYSNYNILFRNFWCTMLASQLIDNGYGYLVKKEDLVNTEFQKVKEKVYFTKNMVGRVYMMSSPHSLIGCIKRYLNIDLIESTEKKLLQKSFINLKENVTLTKYQLDYACNDVTYLYPLYIEQLKYIEERSQQQQIKIENTLTPVIVKMEHKGCLVDIEKHKENIKNWKLKLYEIELELDAIIISFSNTNIKVRGGKFTNKRVKQELVQTALFSGCEVNIENKNTNNINYSSTSQLQDLFERLDQPLPVDDDNKISFAEEPLKIYASKYSTSPMLPFVKLMLDYREYSKLLSTYGEKLFTLLDNNNRLRSNYTQCFTDTGRLTSSAIIKDELGINLANIPKRADMRAIFIPDEGYSFIDSDMTGQEVALVAGYSQEKLLLNAFKEGFDHHSFLASISYSVIFGKKVEIVNENKDIIIGNFTYNSKKLRDVHKSALFSKIYLGGPRRIQNILNEYLCNHIPPDKHFEISQKISNELDKVLKNLISYLKGKVEEVKQKGFVSTTKLGRRRYFDEPDKAYGDAANFDIQSSGSMAIKFALIQIDKWLETKSKELNIKEEELGWISMSIYDQNLICLNDKYIEYATKIQEIMANSLTYFLIDLKGESDLNIRKFWSK